MKICYIIDTLRLGGKERQLLELVKGLISKNYLKPEDILVISIHKGEIYNLLKELGVHTQYAIKNFKKYKYIYLIFKLDKIIKKLRPDIIHSFSPMTSFYTVFLKMFRTFFFIDSTIRSAPSRNAVPLKTKLLDYFNFLFADIIIANSNAGLKSYNAPKNKSFCIHNGFDFSRIKNLENKPEIRTKFGIKTEKVVGMVASFSDKKDYDIFVLAAQNVLSKRNNVTFLAIGNGVNLKKCKKIVKSEFQNKIKFLGKQRNVESIVNVFDIGVLTTNQKVHGEGISNSIMEYMVLGKPVIATDGGGTKELVEDKVSGYLLDQSDQVELENKIIQLLDDEKLRNAFGNKGKTRILTEFNQEKMVRAYYYIYRK